VDFGGLFYAHLALENGVSLAESSENILMRISNNKRSPGFNNGQLEGKYFYAGTSADMVPAFAGIQNQILRLTK
jgi:hypothetical protein